MSNNDSNIQKSSLIAFSLIAMGIVFCSVLIGYTLKQQSHMLQASGISYEQRILLERANEQIHLLLDINNNLSDRLIIKVKNDLLENCKLINANQINLRKLLINDLPSIFNIFDGLTIERLNQNMSEIDSLWTQFYERIGEISNTNLSITRTGYQYWRPVDTLSAHNGLLFKKMADMNSHVFKASKNQNKKIGYIYLIILGISFIALWLIWFLTLRPLSKRLTENYKEIVNKNNDLKFQSTHDSLTHLFNRNAFNNKIALLSKNPNWISHNSLILLDADEFKSINDSRGHQTGDEVLIHIANMLQKNTLDTETFYRFGGDEFAIIIEGISDYDQLLKRLDSLEDNIRSPLHFKDGVDINVTCSIGVAWGGKCGNTIEEVFSAADSALYTAKENGRNHYQLFDDLSDQDISQLIKIEKELHKAVTKKQFIVHYQPIINMETGKLSSLEALARWHHPKLGILLPKDWIDTANRLNLTSKISEQIMDIVEVDFHKWIEKELEIKTVYINITEQMLINGSAYKKLQEMCSRTRHKPRWLGIEITESIVFDKNFNKVKEQLSFIHNAGIKISLDDFGTGFANLSHIRHIPFDSLKIDDSFISQILVDKSVYHIVKSLIELSSALNKKIICEGVENKEVLEELKRLGCKYSQGFLHNKGLSFNQISSIM